MDAGEVVYAQMDGSMILTDEAWREVKVYRLFLKNAEEAILNLGKQGA